MNDRVEHVNIAGIPALVIGDRAENVYLFVHGKMGCKEEAIRFAEIACPAGYQVVSMDLPEHGCRKDGPEKLLPWVAVPEIQKAYQFAQKRWRHIHLRATSIGAWLTMLALREQAIGRALFVSPVVDMEDLIENMMIWAGVTEEELRQKGEIQTGFGETLSWEYLCWARRHPVSWKVPTEILYAERDNLTARSVLDSFVSKTGSGLTVMEKGEHWFHTEEQLHFLREWERGALAQQL